MAQDIRTNIDFNARYKGEREVDRARRGILGLQRPTLILSRRFGNLRLAALGATGAIAGISTIALAKFIKDSVSAFRGFEASMNRVRVLTGTTGEAFNQLSEFALQLSGRTIFTARETAEAMQVLAQAGLENVDIYKTLAPIMNFAAANQLNFAKAAQISTDTLAQFNLELEELTRVSDVLTITGGRSKTNVAELGQAFRVVGPVAAAVGATIEDTSAALALLAEGGERGAQAGTKLRNIFQRLIKPVGAGAKALERLGINVKTANGSLIPFRDILSQLENRLKRADDATAIFGARNLAAANILLTQGIPAFDKFRGIIEAAGGTTQRFAEVQLEGLDGAVKKLSASFEELQVRVGRELAPALIEVLDATRGFIDTAKASEGLIRVFFTLQDIFIRIRFALLSIVEVVKILKNSFLIFFNVVAIQSNALSLLLIRSFEFFVDAVEFGLSGVIKDMKIAVLELARFVENTVLTAPDILLSEAKKNLILLGVDAIKKSALELGNDLIKGFKAPGEEIERLRKQLEESTLKTIDNTVDLGKAVEDSVGNIIDLGRDAAQSLLNLDEARRKTFIGLDEARRETEAFVEQLKMNAALAIGVVTRLTGGFSSFNAIIAIGAQRTMELSDATKATADAAALIQQQMIANKQAIDDFSTATERSLSRATLSLLDFAGSVNAGFAALAGPDAGQLFGPIEQLREQTIQRLETLRQFDEARIQLQQNTEEILFDQRFNGNRREEELQGKQTSLLLKREQAKNRSILGATNALFVGVGSIIQSQGSSNFKLLQGLAIGEAIINTFLGVSQVLADKSLADNTPLKFLNVAAVIATGLAAVSKISSASPSGGGGGGVPTGGAGGGGGATIPSIPGADVPISERLEDSGLQVTINVEGFVGDESELATKIGEVIRQAVGDDVDFGLNQRF